MVVLESRSPGGERASQREAGGAVECGTVEEDVAFGLESLAVPSADMRPIVAYALEQVGLAGFVGRPPATLSGGERQRLALAGAIAQATAARGETLLLLDEPTSHLDPAARVDLMRTVTTLAADAHTTIVWITQELDELCLSHRVVA